MNVLLFQVRAFLASQQTSNVRKEISCGEALAGLIINSLVFSDLPLTLALNLFFPGVKCATFYSMQIRQCFTRFNRE